MLSRKNPEPVPPLLPLLTSIETTEGDTRAAIPAIESGLRSIVLLVETKFVLVSSVAEVLPTTLPTTPAIRAIEIAIPKLTVLVFRFFISLAVTTSYSEIHHGVTEVGGVSEFFELSAIIKSYEREVLLRQLELVRSSIWNLL